MKMEPHESSRARLVAALGDNERLREALSSLRNQFEWAMERGFSDGPNMQWALIRARLEKPEAALSPEPEPREEPERPAPDHCLTELQAWQEAEIENGYREAVLLDRHDASVRAEATAAERERCVNILRAMVDASDDPVAAMWREGIRAAIDAVSEEANSG